jgi:hypothetical protein
VTDRETLGKLLAKRARVRVQNPVIESAVWEGTIIALADTPGIIIECDDGLRIDLPQSFKVTEVIRVTEYGSWLEMRQRQAELAMESNVSFSGRPQAWTTSCGTPSPGGTLCSFPPHSAPGGSALHSWSVPEVYGTDAEVQAAFAQPAPKHNDGPSMHDLVIKDILSRDLQWDLSVGSARHIRDQVAEDLLARKAFGLDKYKTILQTGNGRSFLLDLYQELMDAVCYARGRLLEVPEDGLEWLILFEIYDHVATDLVTLRRLLNAAEASTESLSVRSVSLGGRQAVADSDFSKTWQEMPGGQDIGDQYIMEPGADTAFECFMETARDAFDRLQARRHEGRFAHLTGQVGRGFERPVDDGEPTCYRSGIGVMVHGPGCHCESTS